MKVKLIEHTPNPDLVVATAAKLCYSSSNIDDLMDGIKENDATKTAKFIDMLTKAHHESPIEHVSFTFAIEGVSRITEQQLTRHRISSFSIQSSRYVDRQNAEFSIPPAIEEDPILKEIYDTCMEKDKVAYGLLVEGLIRNYIKEELKENSSLRDSINVTCPIVLRGCDEYYVLTKSKLFKEMYELLCKKYRSKALEDARYVFAGSLQTKIIVTMNARTLFNFFEHRCCKRAQWEIRELAFIMYKLCLGVAPMLFKNTGAPCMGEGCKEGKMSCGKPYVKGV